MYEGNVKGKFCTKYVDKGQISTLKKITKGTFQVLWIFVSCKTSCIARKLYMTNKMNTIQKCSHEPFEMEIQMPGNGDKVAR